MGIMEKIMQVRNIFRLGAVALVAAGSVGAANAAAIGMSDLVIRSLFLSDAGGAPVNPGFVQLSSETRTGNATASYNGVSGTGFGPDNLSGIGSGTVDVGFRCAGPACGSPALSALYGGVFENNTTTFLSPPPSQNYAIGDMLIEGNALAGPITGLTRADAAVAAGTNMGSANATIQNGATLFANFTVGTTFTGRVGVAGAFHLLAWVDDLLSSATASAGWNLGVGCNQSATNNCGADWTDLSFAPTALNLSRSTGNPLDNFQSAISLQNFAFSSDLRTFRETTRYTLAINQSSNVVVNSRQQVPEPGSLALVGLALAALGGVAAVRRRNSV